MCVLPECFRFPEIGHECNCLFWFVCFVLIVDRHHIDYRTLGSQAAANLLGEVSDKSNESISVTAEEFQNAALFLRLGLPSTLIRHENGARRKRSSNRRNWKTPALRFSVNGKHLKNEAFRKI